MNGPLNWFGGKGHLVKEILPLFPPHPTYVEPFCGGASLFFAKESAAVEVLNDKDIMIVNFFRTLRDTPDEFQEKLNLIPYSRYECEEAVDFIKSGDISDPIYAALMFYVACRQTISGLLTDWGYNIASKGNKPRTWFNSIDKLPEIIHRLKQAQIEHLDAIDCIRRYDTPDTFFYIDPPYHHSVRSKARYRVDYNAHSTLLNALNNVYGAWLLSGYHCKLYDSITEKYGWHFKNIETVNYSAPTVKGSGLQGEGNLSRKQKRTEVVWWNENLVKAGHQLNMDEFLGTDLHKSV